MGQVIIKPERDKDYYIIWSDNVDAPVAFGTRSALEEYPDGVRTAENFARADETSSSSRRFPETWAEDWSMVFQNTGLIRRSRMMDLVRRIEYIWDDLYGWHKDPEIRALLDPFEEE